MVVVVVVVVVVVPGGAAGGSLCEAEIRRIKRLVKMTGVTEKILTHFFIKKDKSQFLSYGSENSENQKKDGGV